LKRNESGTVTLYLNDEAIDEARVREMFTKVKPSDTQPVSLSADKGIVYGEVMKVVDLLESLGLRKLSLDTKHVETR